MPLANAAEEIERTRRIPEPLLTHLHDAGLFRMLLPEELGGGEVEAELGLRRSCQRKSLTKQDWG